VGGGSVIEFVKRYAANHAYSQNGEEGILEECLFRIRDPKHDVYCVEIGGNDGRYCSNTAHLIEQGAHGLFVEADPDLCQRCFDNWKDNPNVRVQCATVDAENVNLFVDEMCDVLSLDTDGQDFAIFHGLDARPKVVIVEIDSGLQPKMFAFNADGGASYCSMLQLGINKGYFLLCHTGNLVLVRNDFRQLFPEIVGDGLENSELYFKRDWLAAKAREA